MVAWMASTEVLGSLHSGIDGLPVGGVFLVSMRRNKRCRVEVEDFPTHPICPDVLHDPAAVG